VVLLHTSIYYVCDPANAANCSVVAVFTVQCSLYCCSFSESWCRWRTMCCARKKESS